MNKYKCEITVNGVRTSETVYARCPMEAKKLVQQQYGGCGITWWSVTRANKGE